MPSVVFLGMQFSENRVRIQRFAICAAVFLDMLGFGMIIPDFQLRAEHLGIPGWLIGAMLSSTFAIQLLTSPRWGRAGDRLGRKPIFVVCTLLSASGMLLYGLPGSVLTLTLSRIVSGFGAANVVMAQAIIAASYPEDRRTEGMGRIGAALSGGLMLGPALGGWVAGRFGSPDVGFIAGAASLLGAFLAVACLRGGRPNSDSEQKLMKSVHLLREFPEATRLVVLIGVAWFSLAMLEGTFGRLIEHTMNFHQLQYGIVFSFESAIGVVVQGLAIAWAAARIADVPLLRGAFMMQAFGLGLTPFCYLLAGTPARFAVLLALSGIYAAGSAFANPTINAYCSKVVPSNRHGELFGVLQSARSVGFIVGPTLGGALFDLWPASPYLLAAATCAFAALLVPPFGTQLQKQPS